MLADMQKEFSSPPRASCPTVYTRDKFTTLHVMTLKRRQIDGKEKCVAAVSKSVKNVRILEVVSIFGSLTASLAFCSPFPRSLFSKSLIVNSTIRAAKCAIPSFSCVQACSRSLDGSETQNPVVDIETKLRSFGARYPTDPVHGALSLREADIPNTGPELLSVLRSYGFSNMALSRIASKLGVVRLLNVSPASASNLFNLFEKSLMLTNQQQKRIISSKPKILDMEVHIISATLQALYDLGMRLKDVRRLALRFPEILLLHPSSISRLARFLQSSPLSFPNYKARSFLRRHPWVFTLDIDTHMAPSIDWLTSFVVQTSPDLAQLIVSAPAVLGTKRARLHSVMRLLEVGFHLKEKDRMSVVTQHPRILTCSPEKQLKPVLHFLLHKLRLRYYERRKIVRAFPHILTMDVDQRFMPVLDFFVRRGASNVSRLVNLFPPILCNDLQTDTIPKVEYFMHELGLSMDEILTFPACFSYDLTSRIIPRTQFVQKMGRSVLDIGLSRSISPSDTEFCQFLHVQLQSYISFSDAYVRAIDDNIRTEDWVSKDHHQEGKQDRNETET